jgi:DNA-binding Lrp family transcriptional regulator
MAEKFTTADIARTLAVSERTARRYIKKLVDVDVSGYSMGEDFYNFIISLYSADNLRTSAVNLRTDEDIIVQEFTESEYNEFHKRLSEYPLLKEYIQTILNELEYHKRSADSHNKQMEIILENIRQRNFIEAKEKKIDTD